MWRRGLPVLLGVMLLGAANVVPPSGAQGSVSNCMDYVRSPLWAGDVTFSVVFGDPDSFTLDGTAFVSPGDLLKIEFEMMNRVPDGCAALQNTMGSRTDQIVVKRYDPALGPWQTVAADCSTLASAGGICTITDFVEIGDDAEFGEHRLRYIAGNDQGTFKALVGLERVLVVGLRPDLQPESLSADEPAWRLVTTYGGAQFVWARLIVRNHGTYPPWNPNGGKDFWGRSAFDRNDDVRPDGTVDYFPDDAATPQDNLTRNEIWKQREQRYEPEAKALPPCVGENKEASHNSSAPPWNQAGGSTTDTTNLVCSYKRGARFDMPVSYRIFRPDMAVPVDDGVIAAGALHPTGRSMELDKENTTRPGRTELFRKALFTRNYLAGAHEIEFNIAHDGDDWVPSPEIAREGDNITATVQILGADLRVVDPTVVVEDDAGAGGCGLTIETPCPVGSTVVLGAAFINDGDPLDFDKPYNASLLDRPFKVAAYIDGQIVEEDELGRPVIAEFDSVPKPGESPRTIWSPRLRLPSSLDGGRQTFEVRVDAPENYQFDLNPNIRAEGRVAERSELNTCEDAPEPPAPLDNVFCVTLFFDDDTDPVVHEASIDTGTPDQEVPTVLEGGMATFTTRVTDNSLTHVEARFTLPNGTAETTNMALEDEGQGVWSTTRAFEGVEGTIVYDVHAYDNFGHVGTMAEGIPFQVVPLPKNASIEKAVLNGGSQLGDGEDAPAYRGTTDEPRNWLRVEAEITGTGHEDAFTTDDRWFHLYDPDGELRHTLPLGVYKICDVWNDLTNQSEGAAAGDACEGSSGSPFTHVENVRPRFYVDTRCAADEPPESEPRSCLDEDKQVQAAWSAVDIAWVGTFDIGFHVEDVFDRNRTVTTELRLGDVDGPPEVMDLHFTNPWLEPAERFGIQAVVHDALRVDDVFLRLVKPDGTTETFDLTRDRTLEGDASTHNGTYKAALTSGARGHLDQAGTYNASLVAVDFARSEASVPLPDIHLNDTDVPVLKGFRSVPEDLQEANGPVTWEVHIEDTTAIRTPVLTLKRPATGETVHDLTFNGSRGIWTLEPPLTATAVDLGTWAYTLEAMDFLNHTATAVGKLRVVDNLPPQATKWTPSIEGSNGTVWGSATPTVSADIVDYGAGVERGSLALTVQGERVDASVAEIENGYRLTYEVPPGSAFSHGERVTVEAAARDLTEDGPLEANDLAHTFVVDARGPTAAIDFEPSVQRANRTLVGPDSNVTVLVTDDGSGPAHATLVLKRVQGDRVVAQGSLEIGPGETTRLRDLDAYGGPGTYMLVATAEDRVDNPGEPAETDVVVDSAGPTIYLERRPGQPAEQVIADITDDAGVASALVRFAGGDAPAEERAMVETNGTWQARIPHFPRNTTVTFTVEATDLLSNLARSGTHNFSAGDAVPTIVIRSPADGAVIAGTVPFAWVASDLETAAAELTVGLYHRQGDESFKPVADAQELRNTPPFLLDTTRLPNGPVTLQAIVFDGMNFGEGRVEIIVRNLDHRFSDPRMGGHGSGDGVMSVTPSTDVLFEVDVAGSMRAAYANVTDGKLQLLSVLLEEIRPNHWTGIVRAPATPGTYEIDLTATGPDGVAFTRGAYVFEVQASSGPLAGLALQWGVLTTLFVAAVAIGSLVVRR